ncbi:MAG: formate dehydrogenase accessory sulfurtransferase FdhD [Desulfovibrionaceae bacterium]
MFPPDDATFVQPHVRRYKHGLWQDIQENLAQEISLPISYAGGSKKLWAWPQHLDQLAAGHVLLDCLPQPGTVCGATACLEAGAGFRVSLQPTADTFPSQSLPPRISAHSLLEHMTAFIKAPGLWDNTGCFHRAAMLDIHRAALIHVAEDIGRHNCVDRLAGYAALTSPQALHPARFVLLISSRITASLYHKARRAGFQCMVSRSAVTSGAYTAALNDSCTLLGFCRPEDSRVTIFADSPGRIH